MTTTLRTTLQTSLETMLLILSTPMQRIPLHSSCTLQLPLPTAPQHLPHSTPTSLLGKWLHVPLPTTTQGRTNTGSSLTVGTQQIVTCSYEMVLFSSHSSNSGSNTSRHWCVIVWCVCECVRHVCLCMCVSTMSCVSVCVLVQRCVCV